MKKLSIILLSCSMAVAVQAQIGFSDSLNGTSLANYNWIPLNNAGSATVSFDDTSGNGLGVDVANKSGTAVQGVYFNNTGAYLPVDAMLVASVNWQTANLEDFGICVGSSLSLTPAGAGQDVRSQTQYVFASIRNDSWHITTSGYDGSAGQLTTRQYQPGSGTTTQIAIQRTSANTFAIVFDQGSGLVGPGLFDNGGGNVQTITTSSNVGDVIGFYADVRADGTPAMGYLANLQVMAIPEPASFAFFGLSGLLGLVSWMRRRIA